MTSRKIVSHWLVSHGLSVAGCLIAVGWFASSAPATEADAGVVARAPILLELFTSEGCSSCPPADRLLESLDHTQPFSGAELIVLSEHVDYWNRLGWTDPFSSALITQRQQDYVAKLKLPGPYTPELIVDGQKDVLGSDKPAVRAAIVQAQRYPKTGIALDARRDGANVEIKLNMPRGPRGVNVYVALAEDHAQSRVTRGENAGHTLQHGAVVRTLLLVGKADAQGAFAKNLKVPSKSGLNGAWRVVAFVQYPVSKHVLGVTQVHL